MIGKQFHHVLSLGVVLLGCYGCGEQTKLEPKRTESASGSTEAKRSPEPPSGAVFYLSEPELQRLKPLALRGDSESAERLYYHYKFTDESAAGKDISFKWKVYAAENGSANLMQELAEELSATGAAEDCERAQFWWDRLRQLNPKRELPEKIACIVEIEEK
jgi:hypothetical protein